MNFTSKSRTWQIVILIFAVLLLFFLSFRLLDTFAALDSLNEQLNISRNTWKKIAADKEALQAELSDLDDDIREARLTISESKEKIASLIDENKKLSEDIEGLEAAAQ